MAENPTNRRAVKFWTSDFGTAVQVATADGWMDGCRCWLAWPRPPSACCLLSGRPGRGRATGRLSLHASSRLCWPAWQTASLDPSNHLINSPPVAHDDDDDGDEGGREGGRKNVDVHIRGVMDHLPCSFPKRHAAPARAPPGRPLAAPVGRSLLTHSLSHSH